VVEVDLGQLGDGGDSLECNKEVPDCLVLAVGHQVLNAIKARNSDMSYRYSQDVSGFYSLLAEGDIPLQQCGTPGGKCHFEDDVVRDPYVGADIS
jgi:hypothetical protein